MGCGTWKQCRTHHHHPTWRPSWTEVQWRRPNWTMPHTARGEQTGHYSVHALCAICDHQRWLWLELIQPVGSSARSCMCTLCTVARLAHAISWSQVIWCKLKLDSFRSQKPTDGSGFGCNMPGLANWEDQRGSHLIPGYQMDVMKDQKNLTSVQYEMNWDRLALYVNRECIVYILIK